MKLTAALVLFFSLTLFAAPKEPPVTLLVDTLENHVLKPASAFELRFADAMIADDAVGKTDREAPLVIQPAMTGKWRWVSTQSGIFLPSEPPPLGMTYHVSLADGLKTADGRPFRGALKETFSTPLFRVKGVNMTDYFDAKDAPSQPKMMLLFNANVEPAALATHMKFVDDGKRSVDATVQLLTGKDGFFPAYRSDDRNALTWDAQVREHLAGAPSKKPQAEDEDDDDAPQAPKAAPVFKNQILVSPAKPLPPGKNWQLVVAQGAPSADGAFKLRDAYFAPVGDVKPFTLDSAAVENLAVSGKKVTLTFSKRLAKAVKKEPAKFVRVEPAPANLKVDMGDSVFSDVNTIVLRGDFALGTDYTITVAGETAAFEPFTLGQLASRKVSFAPVPSRLYFQGFAAQQQRAGSRQFGLMSVNVAKLHVTAKRIPADCVTAAFDAYAKYNRDDTTEDEFYQKVDEAKVPGAVVWKKDFSPDAQVDERKLINLNWDEILGPGKTGAVFLTAEQPNKTAPNVKRVGTQALVQVTDLGVMWKQSTDSFLHVFSLTTAEPVAGATVRMLGEDGAKLAEMKTAADGTVRVPKSDDTPKWLLVSRGDDQHLMRFDAGREELEFGRFRINVFGEEEDIRQDDLVDGGKRRGFLFTDRPVYRPGELVHVKGIVRSYMPGESHMAAGVGAKLRIKGPRGRVISERKLTLSDTGSFDTDIQLPKEAVGGFFAQLFFAGDEDSDWSDISCGWQVQEYSPNAFEVKVTPPQTPMLASPIEVPVTAKYYMGKALSKAQLSWSVRAMDEHFAPTGFEDFVFTEALFDWRLQQKLGGEPRFSAQGRADIGADGAVKVSFNVPQNTRLPQPRRVRFLSEITDINQQTVAERSEFLAHSSDFYLGIRRMPDVLREGDALPLQVVAVRTDGTPTTDAVEATVKLTRIEWQTNRMEDADDAENFRSEPLTQLIGQAEVRTAKLVQNGGKWLLAEPDKSDTSLKVEKPGLYIVSAVARDASGHDVITTTSVSVYGKDALAWNYRNRFQIELVADKPEYRAGEQATILVKTPISGPALVTVERENVRRYFFTKLEGNAPAIRVPIEEMDAPNVFVSVLVLRGSQDSPKKFKMPEYRIGYTQVRIARPDAKLYVNVKPSRASYQPGDQAEVVCEVRDVDGKPVANAEVTLWAADEGVLSLTGFQTPDALAFFSKLLRLDVSTGLTIEKLLKEGPDAIAEGLFENKGYLVGGFGKGGEAGVRRNFLGTAYWAGSLRSDVEGKVRASFKVPDGLTRYRVMAVVQTKRDQFGNAESAFEINKPVMLEPAMPRFANVGDQMVLRAVVHNTTEQAGEAKVRIQLDATAKLNMDPAKNTGAPQLVERTVSIPAKGSVAVDFDEIVIEETGDAKWVWTAEFTSGGAKFRDAVETKLKITFPAPLLHEVKQQRVDAAETNVLAGLDPALMQGRGVVRVSLANSRIFELRESVGELLHYPYGCVEQTVSSMLPWMSLRDFRNVLPELKRSDAEFQAVLEKGVARLFTMQTPGGGLAYWPSGQQPDFWGSAYGGLGLVMAKKAGVDVDEESLKRVLDYLSKELRGAADSNDKWQLSPRALACYTLALEGRPEAAYHETLFKKRDTLTQESRALLALAVLETKGGAKMADTLLKMQDKTVEEDFWFGSVARAQGVRLLAWSKLAPKSSAAEAIATAIFDLRTDGSWMTTQGNAWAVLGLSEFIRRTETDRKEVKGALVVGGASADFKLPAKGSYFEKEFSFDAANAIKLSNPGKGRLFTHVKVEARPKTLVAERKDRGYTINRSYRRINDDGSLSDLGEPRVGDRVLVTLEFVAPGRSSYVAIDDPLPAIFEAVNPEFKSQAMAGGELSNVYASDFTELRDDRALFFSNSMWPGKHQIRYLARVRATGSATAPPAKIEEMYHPERFGLSASLVVKGRALK
jgi:uncharacterized protein YfaS (alpha-2-macroglobulin family)